MQSDFRGGLEGKLTLLPTLIIGGPAAFRIRKFADPEIIRPAEWFGSSIVRL
jgi:hypothetical protein